MHKYVVFFLFALALTGCQPLIVASYSRKAADAATSLPQETITDWDAYYRKHGFPASTRPRFTPENSRKLDRMLRRSRRNNYERQQDWGRHNDHYYGGRPGWGSRGVFRLMANKESAPPAADEYLELCAAVGEIYDIGTKAATLLMEALNRAAVQDFGGLQSLGLSAESLENAYRNGGRLGDEDLATVSRQLGISPRKAAALLQYLSRKL